MKRVNLQFMQYENIANRSGACEFAGRGRAGAES